MNIILLSGGSGKRLWPLSNEIRSKQFLKIFKNDDGSYVSMIQRVYNEFNKLDEDIKIVVATSSAQVSSIKNQIGEKAEICIEPCRRDTFPAIALAANYIHDVLDTGLNETIVVCPVDPYVNSDYFREIIELGKIAGTGDGSLTLMGIEPTYPSEKYGYIIPEGKENISKVLEFKEKPDSETAQQYIEKGALWNGGVFAFRLGYLIDKSHELIDFTDYNDLYNKYEGLTKISFDYAVAEKEKNILVKRFSGRWKDLGTWNTLTESLSDSVIGSAVLNDTCENVHVINELDIPVLCMGLKNMVVSASPDGILVSDKEQSSYIKPFVDKFDNQIMFAEKSWGTYKVIDAGSSGLTIKVVLNPGNAMNYHSHEKRNETWTVIEGSGTVIIDDTAYSAVIGSTFNIPAGTKHTVIADNKIVLIEVQTGENISISDKIKHELNLKK